MSQNYNALETGVTTFGQLYGIINANMEAIRTFFSGTSFPANPVQWQPCLRTDTGRFYIYDGSTWQDFTIYLPAYLAIASEVSTARGAAASLDARLDVALNEDGTLKAAMPAGSWWMAEGGTVARVDGTTFTVTGDKTAIYKANRAVFLDQTTDAYGFVSANSTYSSGTSLTTVIVRGCTVDSGLSGVQYGQAPNNAPMSVNEETFAALSGSADKLAYFTGAGAMALTSLTSFARTLIDDADAATARATLGVVVPVRDIARNLTIKNNTTNPNYQADIAADEVMLQDASGNPFKISSLSVTVDITASGANGLDTGSEAISTWYHIWAIAKADGTKAGLLSTSATAPTMPSGYTFKAYLGAVYNNASGNFITFTQVGRDVGIAVTNVLSGGTQTSYTSISLTAVIPTTAKRVQGWHSQDTITAGGLSGVCIASTSGGLGETNGGNYMYRNIGSFSVFIATAQTVYYKCYGCTGGSTVYVTGWSY